MQWTGMGIRKAPATERWPGGGILVALMLFLCNTAVNTAAAAESAPFPETDHPMGASGSEPYTIGPWRLGMSQDQVTSFSQYGPYVPVRVTGGVETFHGVFEGEEQNVSFVFDEKGLYYIQVFHYEGKDYSAARESVLQLFDLFESRFGGAEVAAVTVSAPGGLNREAMEAVLGRVLGTAEEMGRTFWEEQHATMVIQFNMRPSRQPPGSRLTARWGYSSQINNFVVLLLQDRDDVPRAFKSKIDVVVHDNDGRPVQRFTMDPAMNLDLAATP